MYPDDRRYSREHEWVMVDGDACLIGITDFAQEELGDVVFVELPEVGTSVAQNDEVGTVESVKAAAELYSPIGGTVVAVNGKVSDTPELLNEDPHGDGWLVRLEPSDRSQIEGLMSAAEYQELIGAGS